MKTTSLNPQMPRLLVHRAFGVVAIAFMLVAVNLAGPYQARAEGDKKFVIGAILPLSGALAEYGIAAQHGFELAQVDHPELFSNISFVYQDSHWDAAAAVSALNKLALNDSVSLVFNWVNPTSEAVSPIAENRKIPLVAMTLDPAPVRGKEYVVRCINPAADFSRRLAEYLKKKRYRKIGVVIAENTYVQGLFDGLRGNLDSAQELSIVATHPISDTDFRSTVTKLRAQSYDAVGVFLISGQVSSFYRQLQTQKLRIPTFGTDFFESSTEIKMAEGAMAGAVYPHLGTDQSFAHKYVDRYKNDYQIAYAGNAYDMAVLFGALFNHPQEPLSSERIMAELKSTKGVRTGVTGPFSYTHSVDGDSYFKFPVQLKRIVGDSFQAVDE